MFKPLSTFTDHDLPGADPCYKRKHSHNINKCTTSTPELKTTVCSAGQVLNYTYTLLIEAQQQELFKEGDPILFATVIWSMLHGLSVLAIDGNLSVVGNVEAIYEMSYKLLLEGLKNPNATASV